eukprot:scaffold74652_cov18-Tisochrysis_lutea.AAC.1
MDHGMRAPPMGSLELLTTDQVTIAREWSSADSQTRFPSGYSWRKDNWSDHEATKPSDTAAFRPHDFQAPHAGGEDQMRWGSNADSNLQRSHTAGPCCCYTPTLIHFAGAEKIFESACRFCWQLEAVCCMLSCAFWMASFIA